MECTIYVNVIIIASMIAGLYAGLFYTNVHACCIMYQMLCEVHVMPKSALAFDRQLSQGGRIDSRDKKPLKVQFNLYLKSQDLVARDIGSAVPV